MSNSKAGSRRVYNIEKGLEFAKEVGYPLILRSAFSLKWNGGVAHNEEEFLELMNEGLKVSPVREVLIQRGETTVLGERR